jgi:hypothetical protein
MQRRSDRAISAQYTLQPMHGTFSVKVPVTRNNTILQPSADLGSHIDPLEATVENFGVC